MAETITMPSLVDVTSGSCSSTSVKQAAIVVAEGLPLVSTKLLDKIQKWEFVELASLLTHDTYGHLRAVNILRVCILWQQQLTIVSSFFPYPASLTHLLTRLSLLRSKLMSKFLAPFTFL